MLRLVAPEPEAQEVNHLRLDAKEVNSDAVGRGEEEWRQKVIAEDPRFEERIWQGWIWQGRV